MEQKRKISNDKLQRILEVIDDREMLEYMCAEFPHTLIFEVRSIKNGQKIINAYSEVYDV